MTPLQQRHFDALYQQHLDNLTLQGKRPATIDAYARAVRRIAAFFDSPPDNTETMPTHSMTPDIARAISAMTRCRTGALGQSQWACQGCHYDERTPLSCGHRRCPQCQHPNTVLHTPNRRRDMHPHLHAIVPAGFYHPTRKQWHKGNKQYLYPHARQRYHRHQ